MAYTKFPRNTVTVLWSKFSFGKIPKGLGKPLVFESFVV